MYDSSVPNGLPVSTTTSGTCAVGMYAQSSNVCAMCPAGSYTAVTGSTTAVHVPVVNFRIRVLLFARLLLVLSVCMRNHPMSVPCVRQEVTRQ